MAFVTPLAIVDRIHRKVIGEMGGAFVDDDEQSVATYTLSGGSQYDELLPTGTAGPLSGFGTPAHGPVEMGVVGRAVSQISQFLPAINFLLPEVVATPSAVANVSAMLPTFLAAHPHELVVAVCVPSTRNAPLQPHPSRVSSAGAGAGCVSGGVEYAVHLYDVSKGGTAFPSRPVETLGGGSAGGGGAGRGFMGSTANGVGDTEPCRVARHAFQQDVGAIAWKPKSRCVLAVGCRGGVLCWKLDASLSVFHAVLGGIDSGLAVCYRVADICGSTTIDRLSFTNETGRFLAAGSAASTVVVVLDVSRVPTEAVVTTLRVVDGGCGPLSFSCADSILVRCVRGAPYLCCYDPSNMWTQSTFWTGNPIAHAVACPLPHDLRQRSLTSRGRRDDRGGGAVGPRATLERPQQPQQPQQQQQQLTQRFILAVEGSEGFLLADVVSVPASRSASSARAVSSASPRTPSGAPEWSQQSSSSMFSATLPTATFAIHIKLRVSMTHRVRDVSLVGGGSIVDLSVHFPDIDLSSVPSSATSAAFAGGGRIAVLLGSGHLATLWCQGEHVRAVGVVEHRDANGLVFFPAFRSGSLLAVRQGDSDRISFIPCYYGGATS